MGEGELRTIHRLDYNTIKHSLHIISTRTRHLQIQIHNLKFKETKRTPDRYCRKKLQRPSMECEKKFDCN